AGQARRWLGRGPRAQVAPREVGDEERAAGLVIDEAGEADADALDPGAALALQPADALGDVRERLAGTAAGAELFLFEHAPAEVARGDDRLGRADVHAHGDGAGGAQAQEEGGPPALRLALDLLEQPLVHQLPDDQRDRRALEGDLLR